MGGRIGRVKQPHADAWLTRLDRAAPTLRRSRVWIDYHVFTLVRHPHLRPTEYFNAPFDGLIEQWKGKLDGLGVMTGITDAQQQRELVALVLDSLERIEYWKIERRSLRRMKRMAQTGRGSCSLCKEGCIAFRGGPHADDTLPIVHTRADHERAVGVRHGSHGRPGSGQSRPARAVSSSSAPNARSRLCHGLSVSSGRNAVPRYFERTHRGRQPGHHRSSRNRDPRRSAAIHDRRISRRGSSRLLKNSAKWDRQIDPVVLRCSQH